jgi:sigma-E factor negative regulatory protein RseA
MTDQDKELRMRISMLLDSDLDGRDNPRLLDKLENDALLQATWANYNLIGDVLRSPKGVVASTDFSAKISAMIADEPTVLAPKSRREALYVRPKIVNFALAASLAVAAVLVGKSVNENSEMLQQVASLSGSPTPLAARLAQSSDNPAESQFNDYLVMHNESAYMAGSAGMLPYVRQVSLPPDR